MAVSVLRGQDAQTYRQLLAYRQEFSRPAAPASLTAVAAEFNAARWLATQIQMTPM